MMGEREHKPTDKMPPGWMPGTYCKPCGQRWPCDAASLTADLEQVREQLRLMTLAANAESERVDELFREREQERREIGLAHALAVVEAFIARVNQRAEHDIEIGNPITGAHHRAQEFELQAFRLAASVGQPASEAAPVEKIAIQARLVVESLRKIPDHKRWLEKFSMRDGHTELRAALKGLDEVVGAGE